jgi:hypothetical protein
MKKLLALFTMAATVMMYSCGDDPVETFDAPKVSAPSASQVQVGSTIDVSFTYTAEAGFASSTVSATNGTATISTDGEADAASGTITVAFTGTTAGAASVTLTVTDADGVSDDNTAVVEVTAEPVTETVVISGFISENTTWTADKIYELAGRVVVDSGATLTIEAGSLIKGREGEGAAASALVVARGGKLMANGTAAAPIIMTSVLDDTDLGEYQSFGTGLDETQSGTWGGLIILGYANISADAESEQIEGIPADFSYGLYGGTDDDDNSGSITYVSVRHGGSLIGEGNEINGITFGGVGSGTTVNHIEVVANKDDGIEMFGGSVDISNVVIWAADDDAIDIDQAYSGTVDNAVVIAFDGTDHGLEIDGPEGTLAGSFTVSNVTIKGYNDELGQYRDGATGTTENVYFFGFQTIADGEGDLSYDDETDGTGLTFSALEVTLAPDASELSEMLKEEAMQAAGSEVAEGSNTVGADTSVFGWTLASGTGALDF